MEERPTVLAVIILGSPTDSSLGELLENALAEYGIPTETRIASAHKTPGRLLEVLCGYEADGRHKVFVTVAGRSNALSGFVDAQVSAPVVACPPYSDKYGGSDIWSSLRTPSGVAPAVVLEPENAALLVAKILALAHKDLRDKVLKAQEQQRRRLEDADAARQR